MAATALGVFALIQANKDDTSGQTATAADLARVQSDLTGRIDDLKAQVDALPTSDDLSKLDNRIKDVEKKADSTGSDIDKLNGRVDDLEKRVDDLEQQQSQTPDEHHDDALNRTSLRVCFIAGPGKGGGPHWTRQISSATLEVSDR